MIQLRPGDLVAVRQGDDHVLFAILTKQIWFGGHWSFVFHGLRRELPSASDDVVGPGFNVAVDFIVPKRENRVVRISRDNDFSSLNGPELLQQPPARGETNYHIYRWKDGQRREAERLHFTPSPTPEEKAAGHYACVGADRAWELAERRWTVDVLPWDPIPEAPGVGEER